MAPKGRTLTVYLAADTKKAEAQLSGFKKTMKTLGKVGAVAAAAGVAVLTKKLIDLGKESINLASDLEEVNSKIEAIFGSQSASSIDAWAQGAADAFGLSTVAAKEAASQFAVFGKDAGLTGAELENFSTTLVELGADMASFNNTSLEQALGAIKSGLAGSSEPLLNFGVNTQVAALKQQALADGLLESGEAIDASNKTMLVYNQLMKKTTDQQGDFARTSDGLANSQRILAARMDDLKTQIGAALLPVMKELVTIVSNDILPAFQEFWEAIDEDVMAALTRFSDWLKGDGRDALNTFVDLMRYQFIPLMGLAYDYVTQIIDPFRRMANAVNDVAVAFGASGSDGVNPELSKFTRMMIINEPVLKVFIELLNKIADALENVAKFAERVTSKMRETEAAIRGVINAAAGLVGLPGVGQISTGNGGGSWTPRSTINVTVNAGVGDPVEIARTIKRTLGDANANLGVAW
jgi:RecA/RadA recombinase